MTDWSVVVFGAKKTALVGGVLKWAVLLHDGHCQSGLAGSVAQAPYQVVHL